MANHRGPVGVEAIGDFDTLVDARSPSEYALDHLPGAVNHPVLNDEERALVGTIYKQKSAFEARRIGAGAATGQKPSPTSPKAGAPWCTAGAAACAAAPWSPGCA